MPRGPKTVPHEMNPFLEPSLRSPHHTKAKVTKQKPNHCPVYVFLLLSFSPPCPTPSPQPSPLTLSERRRAGGQEKQRKRDPKPQPFPIKVLLRPFDEKRRDIYPTLPHPPNPSLPIHQDRQEAQGKSRSDPITTRPIPHPLHLSKRYPEKPPPPLLQCNPIPRPIPYPGQQTPTPKYPSHCHTQPAAV